MWSDVDVRDDEELEAGARPPAAPRSARAARPVVPRPLRAPVDDDPARALGVAVLDPERVAVPRGEHLDPQHASQLLPTFRHPAVRSRTGVLRLAGSSDTARRGTRTRRGRSRRTASRAGLARAVLPGLVRRGLRSRRTPPAARPRTRAAGTRGVRSPAAKTGSPRRPASQTKLDRRRVVVPRARLLARDDRAVWEPGEHVREVLRPVVEPVELPGAEQRVPAERGAERIGHLRWRSCSAFRDHARPPREMAALQVAGDGVDLGVVRERHVAPCAAPARSRVSRHDRELVGPKIGSATLSGTSPARATCANSIPFPRGAHVELGPLPRRARARRAAARRARSPARVRTGIVEPHAPRQGGVGSGRRAEPFQLGRGSGGRLAAEAEAAEARARRRPLDSRARARRARLRPPRPLRPSARRRERRAHDVRAGRERDLLVAGCRGLDELERLASMTLIGLPVYGSAIATVTFRRAGAHVLLRHHLHDGRERRRQRRATRKSGTSANGGVGVWIATASRYLPAGQLAGDRRRERLAVEDSAAGGPTGRAQRAGGRVGRRLEPDRDRHLRLPRQVVERDVLELAAGRRNLLGAEGLRKLLDALRECAARASSRHRPGAVRLHVVVHAERGVQALDQRLDEQRPFPGACRAPRCSGRREEDGRDARPCPRTCWEPDAVPQRLELERLLRLARGRRPRSRTAAAPSSARPSPCGRRRRRARSRERSGAVRSPRAARSRRRPATSGSRDRSRTGSRRCRSSSRSRLTTRRPPPRRSSRVAGIASPGISARSATFSSSHSEGESRRRIAPERRLGLRCTWTRASLAKRNAEVAGVFAWLEAERLAARRGRAIRPRSGTRTCSPRPRARACVDRSSPR